jgi:hypothetical protein
MAATYAVFPDAREGDAPIAQANKALRERNVSAPQYHAPFRPTSATAPIVGWISSGQGLEPEGMIAILRGIEWEFPFLLVYRTSEDTRWAFVPVGLSSPEWGEVDE